MEYYIIGHGCKLDQKMRRNPNIEVSFDTPDNQLSCGNNVDINFDRSLYVYEGNRDDYFVSFKDSVYSTNILSICGIFDYNNKRVEILNVTNGLFKPVKLSQLVDFISKKNTVTKFYCSLCRVRCDNIDNIEFEEDLNYGGNIFDTISLTSIDTINPQTTSKTKSSSSNKSTTKSKKRHKKAIKSQKKSTKIHQRKKMKYMKFKSRTHDE